MSHKCKAKEDFSCILEFKTNVKLKKEHQERLDLMVKNFVAEYMRESARLEKL